MVFLFSLILWAVVLHSIWLCWFIIGGLLLGFVGPINRELNQLISGQFEIGAAFLLITGAVITTFALRWLIADSTKTYRHIALEYNGIVQKQTPCHGKLGLERADSFPSFGTG